MYPGLPAELTTLLAAHHSMRVVVQVVDLDHRAVGDPISGQLLDGQVNVDLNAEVTRSATLSLLDPNHTLNFDSDSPADGALYADRMLSIRYGLRSPTPGSKWIDVPIFTGPVTKFSRNGAVVSVECQGKESLATGSLWTPYTAKKNRPKRDIIVEVMQAAGEKHFALDHFTFRMPGDAVLLPDATPWAFARTIAGSMGAQLYYDGAGRLRLRDYPERPAFTFRAGTGGTVVDQPSVDFLIDNVRNAVRVTGRKKKGKGAKGSIAYDAVAPSSHPLSPTRLGRNGRARYLPDFYTDEKIGSVTELKRVATARLNAALASVVDVKFSSLVVPHLDAGDYIALSTPDFAMTNRLTSFSIPLAAAGQMSVGYNRRTTPNRKAIR